MTEDFDRRLQEAEKRRTGAERPAREPGTSPWNIGARVGVELLSALVVGLAIGWGLDRWLHTGPLMLIIGVLLGGAAGIANVWRLMAPKR